MSSDTLLRALTVGLVCVCAVLFYRMLDTYYNADHFETECPPAMVS